MDALSEDGAHGLTVIGFVGSVFSPYYRWSGRARPEDHATLNVVLHGPRARRWAMTERRAGALSRGRDALRIGASEMAWDGDALRIRIDEMSPLVPRRIRGWVTVRPRVEGTMPIALDEARRHAWWPIAPCAEVEVRLDRPAVAWRGRGYLDANAGAEPAEDAFSVWTWSRASRGERTRAFYEVTERGGRRQTLALGFEPATGMTRVALPPRRTLPRSRWRMPRAARGGPETRLKRTLLDSPFYARSIIETRIDGEPALGVHESIDLDRLTHPLVQAMLPWRMPRRII